jgi:eukaryotic-like serine/threonine-protein kinase
MSAASSSRYDTILKLASGGMATVWVGTVRGALGFRQLVAIKKPHPHLLEDASYRNELVAEARLASLINHANVIDVRDVEVDGDAISLIMDYIEGASLGELIVAASKAGTRLPPRVAVRIALDALAGLHAAHELVDERGRHVGLVHRDVSPQNIVVGVDGLARVADFGVAKFSRKNADSSEGSLKGKLAYMAPEYIRGEPIDRRFDVFALGIVLWEALAGRRLFRGASEPETIRMLLEHEPESLATAAPEAAALAGVVATALARPVEQRFQNAQAMAAALETTALGAGLCGGQTEVATALKELVGASIEARRGLIRAKLANEPSVASLLGVPPLVPEAPSTERDAPRTTVAPTPKLGGAGHVDANGVNATQPATRATLLESRDAANTATAATLLESRDVATSATARAALESRTVVPSTLPMTPRMAGAPVQRTLASAAASQPPAAPPWNVGGSTLASATPADDPSLAARRAPAGHADTQMSFNEPSARTAHDLEPAPELPRNKTLPLLVGGIVVLLAAVALALVATRASTPPSTSAPPGAAAAAAEPPANTPGAEPEATTAGAGAPTPTVTPSPTVAEATATTTTTRPTSPSTGRRAAGASRAGTSASAAPEPPPSPAAAPAPTGKKPPPNPYANE